MNEWVVLPEGRIADIRTTSTAWVSCKSTGTQKFVKVCHSQIPPEIKAGAEKLAEQ